MYSERFKVCFSSSHVFDENSNVISAGFIATAQKGYSPAYYGYREGEDGTAGTLLCDREVSIVGSDCTLVSYENLNAIGGLNSSFLTLDGAVKDASYRATLNGYRNISCSSKLYVRNNKYISHSIKDVVDSIMFIDFHKKFLASGDPYYNKNFSSNLYDFK